MPTKRKPKGNGPKRGRLSAAEEAFIEKHRDRMTAEQMADRLNRIPSTVQKYLGNVEGRAVKAEITLSVELETRPEWEQWQQQFTPDELKFFKYRYVQFMSQFRDDILPTEEIQVFQFITLDILTQRVMREQKKIVAEQEYIQKRLEQTYKEQEHVSELTEEEVEEIDKDIRYMEGRYADLSSQLKPISQRHESYLMRQSNMLKELKATRDQRVKVLEGSKQSFLGFLRALQDDEFREEQGDDLEKHRIATDKEYERLSKPHKYVDGTEDLPLLTPETAVIQETLSGVVSKLARLPVRNEEQRNAQQT